MAAMGERFELRLDEDTLSRIDSWRKEQSDLPSRSEAIRRLIETGLIRNSSENVRFSDGEKLLLLMMKDLFEHVGIKDPDSDPQFIADVIYGGHYWAPKWVQTGVFHDHSDDPRDLRFVLDVLDMWDYIERGYDRLTKKDKAAIERDAAPLGKHVRFSGFDGNNESSQMGIARFLVEKMGRFSRFKGRDLNSHMPTRAAHEGMLRAFMPMRDDLIGDDLDAQQITTLLLARKHPG